MLLEYWCTQNTVLESDAEAISNVFYNAGIQPQFLAVLQKITNSTTFCCKFRIESQHKIPHWNERFYKYRKGDIDLIDFLQLKVKILNDVWDHFADISRNVVMSGRCSMLIMSSRMLTYTILKNEIKASQHPANNSRNVTMSDRSRIFHSQFLNMWKWNQINCDCLSWFALCLTQRAPTIFDPF